MFRRRRLVDSSRARCEVRERSRTESSKGWEVGVGMLVNSAPFYSSLF